MSNEAIAPVRIRDMDLIDVSFNLAQAPADSMTLKMRLDYDSSGVEMLPHEAGYQVTLQLSVNAAYVNVADQDDVRAEAHVRVLTTVYVTKDIDNSGEDPKRYLEGNALSMSYAHARSCLMMIAGMTPMQSFVLPPILPYALLDIAGAPEDA